MHRTQEIVAGVARPALLKLDGKMMKLGRTTIVTGVLWVALASMTAYAPAANGSPELTADLEHKGIVVIGPYQIFPENRPGNGVYLNNQLMVSKPGRTVIQVVPLPQEGRFVYLTRDDTGEAVLGVQLSPKDPAPRIQRVADGLYYAVMIINEVVYKKVYRIVQQNTIMDVLPSSKTADGITPGESGLLFYHVSGAETNEQDGKTIYQFSLRLHLLKYQEEHLRSLDYPVINTLPRLQLAWKNDASVEYTLANGSVQVLSTAQFQ